MSDNRRFGQIMHLISEATPHRQGSVRLWDIVDDGGFCACVDSTDEFPSGKVVTFEYKSGWAERLAVYDGVLPAGAKLLLTRV